MENAQKNKRTRDIIEVRTGGCNDCGGRCPYKVWVENGVARRIEPYEDLRPCVRGYAYRERAYSPERLRSPLERVGERGEGKFKEISWERALDKVAAELIRVKEKYGNTAILLALGSAFQGHLNGSVVLQRLINLFGGYTGLWGSLSAEAAAVSSRITYGTLTAGHSRDDTVNSKLILLWGFNPAESIIGTDTTFNLVKAKEAGARLIAIDPRYTNTAAVLADQWLPIYPGTDTALLLAMAFTMIQKGLHDRNFLDTYTVGFDAFADYVLGKTDGEPKTPAWAEQITGVAKEEIEKLAIDYATTRPAANITGLAPGRTAYGEQWHRAAATLAAMTGNIGIHGGEPAGFLRLPGVPSGERLSLGPTLPPLRNPVEPEGLGPFAGSSSIDPALKNRYRVHSTQAWDAILKGKAGGYPSDIKFLYIVMRNVINQYPNTKKALEAIPKLEFIVIHEQFMTPSAKFADIVLPVTTHWEKNDYMRPWLTGTYFIHTNKVMEPFPGCKSDFEICQELAVRLGVTGYSDKSEEEWIKEIIALAPDMTEEIADYAKFKKESIHRIQLTEPVVSFKEQIKDPQHNPFSTPSGKIEIYSEALAEMENPLIPPIPTYIPTWEGRDDAMVAKYPLQLVTFHAKTRTHSTLYNIALVRDLEPHTVWINPLDASPRGIAHGDKVKAFNQRGETVLTANLTQRIMPGVVALGEGAWHRPDEHGIDVGGCANLLSKDQPSPLGSHASNTALVQVEKQH
ncbi:molybdopterin-dependent oxidoreductase [Chloroflexota bacterium]